MSVMDEIMDIYDILDKYGDLPRSCPKCGGDDVKFGNHSKEYRGFTTSAQCSQCHYSESGDNPEIIFLNWTENT